MLSAASTLLPEPPRELSRLDASVRKCPRTDISNSSMRCPAVVSTSEAEEVRGRAASAYWFSGSGREDRNAAGSATAAVPDEVLPAMLGSDDAEPWGAVYLVPGHRRAASGKGGTVAADNVVVLIFAVVTSLHVRVTSQVCPSVARRWRGESNELNRISRPKETRMELVTFDPRERLLFVSLTPPRHNLIAER